METRETKRQGVQNWESWAKKPNPKSELDEEVIDRKIEKLRLTSQQQVRSNRKFKSMRIRALEANLARGPQQTMASSQKKKAIKSRLIFGGH